MGVEIKLASGNGPYCFRIHGQIHQLVSIMETDWDMDNFAFYFSAEATRKWLQDHQNQVCMAGVMQ
jgi:hypothetical protein